MNLQELHKIIEEELLARPGAPNVEAWCNLALRELRFLPAIEVRRAIQAFYGFPTCPRCGTRSHRWPHPEEIRQQIPETVIAKISKHTECPDCEGTGWVQGSHGGVIRCHCKVEYRPSEPVTEYRT